MLHLMNANVMPQPGRYECNRITEEEFVHVLRTTPFKSSVGYRQTADWIEQITGVVVPFSREMTVLEDGDQMLVCKLAYRTQGPKTELQEEEWEYYLIDYVGQPGEGAEGR